MKIEATDRNKAIIAAAQRALANMDREAKSAGYDYLRSDIRKLRGMLLIGNLDTDHLAALGSRIDATQHERQASEVQTQWAAANDFIHLAL